MRKIKMARNWFGRICVVFFETTKFEFENWCWITNKTYRMQRLRWLFTYFEHNYYRFHSTGIVGHYKNTHARFCRDEQYYTPAARSNWRQKGRNFEFPFISMSHSAYITLRIIMPFCKSCHMPFPRKPIPSFSPTRLSFFFYLSLIYSFL